MKQPMEKADPLFLACVIMVSVLLFGAVEAWAAGLAGAAVIIYFNIRLHDAGFWDTGAHLTKKEGSAGDKASIFSSWMSWEKGMFYSAAGFMSVALFSLAPLPAPAIAFFSKKEYGLIEGLPLRPPAWHSLSINGHETTTALVRFFICMMVFSIAVRAGRDRRAPKRIFSVLAFFGFALVFFAVIQRSAWDGRIYWFRGLRNGGRPFGPFVNRNHFAGFMGMLVPPVLALAFEARRTEKTVLFAIVSAVMAAGLFYSLSRGGIISFFVSMFFFLALVRAGKPGGRRRSVYYLIFIFFSAAFLFYMFYAGISPVVDRFEVGGLSSRTRLEVWVAALRAASDFRWFGTGLGTFREVFPLYNPGLQKTFDFAHNDYINITVETGLAGIFFLLVFFASFARGVYNYCRRQGPSYFTAGLLASVAYMLVHSFFDFNLHIPSNAITFAVVSGLATSRLHMGCENAAGGESGISSERGAMCGREAGISGKRVH